MGAVRFWGTVLAIKPRLVLSKFEGETTARCDGYTVVLEGTQTVGTQSPTPGRFFVALGTATQIRRDIQVGDLLRGEAHPVPESAKEVHADLYRVGVLRTIARASDTRTALPELDPPRTDAPLTPDATCTAPREPLHPENLAEGGDCELCPYGVVVPVVRLSDPRDYRNGHWQHIPACLGPEDCSYFRPRPH